MHYSLYNLTLCIAQNYRVMAFSPESRHGTTG